MAGNAGAGVLGWRVARPRALADRLILAAAFATILLATLIVSAGPMYATAVTSAGLRQTIASAPPEQVGIQVNARGTAVDVDEVTATVDGVAEAGFEGPVTTTHLVRSDSLSIVALTSDEQVVKAGYQEAIADHVDLVDGRLPEGPDEAMLHAAAAEALGLTAGDAVSLAALGREADVRPLQLVGTFVPTEPADDYWWNEALLRDGIAPGSEIDEVALFLLSEDGFRAAFGGENATYAWRFLPEAEGFDAATLGASRRALDGQLRLLGDTSTRSAALNVQTELGALLADTQRALGATRAAVIVTTTQLGLLAVFALVLATGLLVESRQIETALLRSRDALRPVRGSNGFSWVYRDEAEWHVLRTIDTMRERHAVGPVVLAGFSQGANIALMLGQSHPERFHAVIPVAGHYEPDVAAPPTEGTRPRWCLVTGERDPWAKTFEVAEAAFHTAGMTVRRQVVPGLGHAFPRGPRGETVLRDALGWALQSPPSPPELPRSPQSQAVPDDER